MRDKVTLLAGVPEPRNEPWTPFSQEAIDFLSALAEEIRASDARRVEEVAAFGFWCRQAHLESLRRRHAYPLPRLGRGLLFHVAPSNVPTMFAYTLAIGILAGNANTVRVSSRHLGPEERLCALIAQIMERPEFRSVRERTSIVSYERDDEITAEYLARCDGRVIWGGDATVASIRAIPMPAHAVEICFPDRRSLALLSQAVLSGLGEEELAALARRFYNDTYLMDQNACSSPQLVVWLTDGGTKEVRARWWNAVAREARARYVMGPYQAARKYERLCTATMTLTKPRVTTVERYGGNYLYVAELSALPERISDFQGGFGLFFQGEAAGLEGLLPMLAPQVQTLSCAGVDCGDAAAFLARHHARGVDRVVPMGQALEMDTIWDGKDLVAELSRIIG